MTPSLPKPKLITPFLAGCGVYWLALLAAMYWFWPQRVSPDIPYPQIMGLAFALPVTLLVWLATQRRLQIGWTVLLHALLAGTFAAIFSLLLTDSLAVTQSAFWVYSLVAASGLAALITLIWSAVMRRHQLPVPPYRIILVLTIIFAALFVYQGTTNQLFLSQSEPAASVPPVESVTAETLAAAINSTRTAAELTPLAISPALTQATDLFVQQAATNTAVFQSMSKDAATKQAYAKQFGYKAKDIADIVATAGKQATATDVATQLFKDPKIQAIFLDRGVTDLGVAIKQFTFDSDELLVYILVANSQTPATASAKPAARATPTARPQFTGIDLFAAVNQSRKEHGVPEFRQRTELCTVASIRLNEQLEKGHIDNHAGFQAVLDKYKDQLGDYSHVAENLAEGYPTGAATVKAWEGSPGHLELLKDGSYTFGCTAANSGFAVLVAAY